MDSSKLKKTINDILSEYGFKKKGNRWIRKGEEISEKAVLQKSSFGNYYYFRYYYNINNLSLDDNEGHVLASIGVSEQEYKSFLQALDLENVLDDEQRREAIKQIFSESVLCKTNMIDSEEKLRAFLVQSGLPVLCIVSQYLHLPSCR